MRRGRSCGAEASITYREAGHAVACHYERIGVLSVTIEPDVDSAGKLRPHRSLAGRNRDVDTDISFLSRALRGCVRNDAGHTYANCGANTACS